MAFFRQPAPVTICPGFHLHGGETIKVKVFGPNGSEYEINGTINVITGSTCAEVEDSVVETIVLLED